jgi:dTDP-4-amino-4,6-dideoxygalactose transaminase
MTTTSLTASTVPFLDLDPIHEPLRAAVLDDFAAVAASGAFINGPQVGTFEEAFAAYCRTRRCVGLASGLDALRLALLAAGLAPDDEVIVPANTFIATLEAVTQAGAKPVVVDVSECDLNMDPEAVEAAIGPRTRFVLPVHLYGQLADMRSLAAIAERHGLSILEDACQAHGAVRDGVRAGGAGHAAAFSFYPGKNLGAWGDAGALVSNDDELVAGVQALREHGQRAKYEHELVGYTARLDTLQAIVLLHKLPHLDGWNDERRAVAHAYNDALAGIGDLVLPPVAPRSEPVWHLYVVQTTDPRALASYLRERGIGSGFHYPEPVHLSAAYKHLGYSRGAFPVTEALAERTLSLPIFPGMRDEQVEAVVDGVTAFFRAR